MKNLNIDAIRLDGKTQPRLQIDTEAVARYAEAMTDGTSLPPMVVFFDGAEYWLADGFHRYHANKQIGAVSVACDVHQGTVKDARIFARGANKTHGLPMSNADKKAAVLGMLEDCAEWSNVQIARHVGVSDKTVAAHRQSIIGNSEDAPVRTVERAGKTYTMDTSGQKEAGAQRAAQKPAAKPKRELPEAEPSREEYETDELRGAVQALSEENDRLADRLAVEAMDATEEERTAAATTIAELRADLKTTRAELDATRSSRDSLLVENGALKQQCQSLLRKLKKQEQAA